MDQPLPRSAVPESPSAVTEFRTPPRGAIIFFALVGLGGIALLIRGLVVEAVAMCKGVPMAVDALCELRSRRSGRYTQDYQKRLDIAEATVLGQQLAGVLVLVAAIVVVVLLVLAWRRDLRLLEGLAQETPELSHVDSGLLGPVFGAICAILLLTVGGYFLAYGQRLNGFGLLTVLGAAGIVAGLVVLVIARPKGATALLLYPSELGVVSRGARSSVPYPNVLHYVGNKTHSFNWVDSGRGSVILSEDESSPFRDVLAERTHAAAQTAPQRLAQGETVSFGDITLQSGAMTIGGKAVPLSEIAQLRRVTSGNETNFEAVDRSGAVRGRANAFRVANLPTLRWLLTQAGVALA